MFSKPPSLGASLAALIALGCTTAGAQVAPSTGERTPRLGASASAFAGKPREQTDLDITVTAASDVNPDAKGRASPIRVRLYELRSGNAFELADYFGLQANDQLLLGDDWLARDEFILRPGESKRIQRKSQPDIGAVAVVAGYRDLVHSEWRAVQPIAPGAVAAWYRFGMPNQQAKLQVQLLSNNVRITALQ